MPKISIVVTVWNLEDCITEALESLQRQTVKPYEFLIIDDGSEDLSKELISKYVARNTNWYFYPLAHEGVANSRNLGLANVTGDYVLFFDGDDVYEPNLVEKLNSALTEGPDIVAFRSLELDNYSGMTIKSEWTVKAQHCSRDLRKSIFFSFVGWPWDKLFKVSFLRKNHLLFPNLLNSEDLVFVYSALLKCENISIVDDYLIKHRINRSTSLSNNLGGDGTAFYTAILLLEDFIKKDPILWKEIKQYFQEWSIDLTLWATKTRHINFDDLTLIYPKIDWQLQDFQESFYPNLRPLLRLAESTNCEGFLWFLSYNLYKVRKFGLKRTFFLVLTFLLRKVKNTKR